MGHPGQDIRSAAGGGPRAASAQLPPLRPAPQNDEENVFLLCTRRSPAELFAKWILLVGGWGDTSSYKTRECGPEPLKPVGICWLAVSAEGGQVLWITAPPTRPRLPTGRTGFAANPAVPPCRCLLAPHRRASSSTPPPCHLLQEALLFQAASSTLPCPHPLQKRAPQNRSGNTPKGLNHGTRGTVSQVSDGPAIGPRGTRNEAGVQESPQPGLLWLEISPPPEEGAH